MTEDKDDEKEEIKENSRKTVSSKRLFLFVAGAVLIGAALGMLAIKLSEYRRLTEIYEQSEKQYVIEVVPTPEAGIASAPSEEPDAQPTGGKAQTSASQADRDQTKATPTQPQWYEMIRVNIDALCSDHPEVIGWLRFEDGGISYPIAFSGDNVKYLKTAYTGEETVGGSIFLDGESTPDLSDPHSLVYGHNMRNGSMFGKLWTYAYEESFYSEHRYFQIVTAEASYRYEIFACGLVPAADPLYEVYGKEPAQMGALIDELNSMAVKGTKLRAKESDHIVTLSTCGGENKRLVVSAVRIAEHKEEEEAGK